MDGSELLQTEKLENPLCKRRDAGCSSGPDVQYCPTRDSLCQCGEGCSYHVSDEDEVSRLPAITENYRRFPMYGFPDKTGNDSCITVRLSWAIDIEVPKNNGRNVVQTRVDPTIVLGGELGGGVRRGRCWDVSLSTARFLVAVDRGCGCEYESLTVYLPSEIKHSTSCLYVCSDGK